MVQHQLPRRKDEAEMISAEEAASGDANSKEGGKRDSHDAHGGAAAPRNPKLKKRRDGEHHSEGR